MVKDKSHRAHQDFFHTVSQLTPEQLAAIPDHYQFTPKQLPYWKHFDTVKLQGRAGSLFLWDSRTTHPVNLPLCPAFCISICISSTFPAFELQHSLLSKAQLLMPPSKAHLQSLNVANPIPLGFPALHHMPQHAFHAFHCFSAAYFLAYFHKMSHLEWSLYCTPQMEW